MKYAKNILAYALAVTIAASAMNLTAYSVLEGDTAPAFASAPDEDGAEYTDGTFTVDDEGTLTGYSGDGGKVTIPSKVKGKTVTSISGTAFQGNTTITSVSIPGTVTALKAKNASAGTFEGCTSLSEVTGGSGLKSIEARSFYRCTALTSFAIPDSVTSIGNDAFGNCKSLLLTSTGNNVKSIGDRAFEGCLKLGTLTLGDAVETIGQYAFYGCKYISSLKFGSSVKTIGKYAFSGCTALGAVELPDALTEIGERAFIGDTGIGTLGFGSKLKTIGEGAFESCSSITEAQLPDTVTVLGARAFYGCTKLADVKLPAGLKIVEKSTFYECTGLGSITIPSGVTEIGQSAFYGCKTMTLAELGSGLTSIGDSAFRGCSALKQADLPAKLTTIGAYAFTECSSLKSVSIPSGVSVISNGAFDGCKSVTELIIPEGVKTIDNYAFRGIGIKKLVLPDSVYNLGNYAFASCTGLVNVTFGSGIVSVIDNPFIGSAKIVTLHLDKSLKSLGNDVFNGCKDVIEIYYSGNCEEWNSFMSVNSQSYLASISARYTVYCSDGEVAGENAVKKTVKSINIVPPLKTEYLQGDELDLTGGKVEVIYNKGEPLVTDITEDMISGYNKDKKGKQTITVKYFGKKGTFTVTVNVKPEDYTNSGVKLNGEPVKDLAAAVKAIGSEEGTFTITVDAAINVKSFTFPKNAKLIIESAGEGCISTAATSMAPKNDLTLKCPIITPAGKSISLKCAKDHTLTIDTGDKFGTISGAKGSKLVINTTVEADTVKNFDEISTGTYTLTVTKAMSGVSIGSANVKWSASAAKKISLSGVSGTLKVTVSDEIRSGDPVFMYAGKEPLDRTKITVTNKDDGKKLEAFVYKKEVRAEIPDLLKLNSENCPSWEYALLQMNDAETNYTVEFSKDISIAKFALPTKIKSLTLNGKGHTVDLLKVKSVTAKYALTLNDIKLTAGETPVAVKTVKTELTLTNCSVGAVTAGGKLTLNGTVSASGAVSAGELAAVANAHITLYSLAVTANGITEGSGKITVKIVDKKTGEAVVFTQDEKKDVVVIKTFKLPKDGVYTEGSLVLDAECGTSVLVYSRGKLIIPKPPKEEL